MKMWIKRSHKEISAGQLEMSKGQNYMSNIMSFGDINRNIGLNYNNCGRIIVV